MKPRVLVLDDDMLALKLYSRELSQNYQVYTCDTIQKTRQFLQEIPLDIVVVEPAVENDAGWDLIQEIQHSQHPPALILCSVLDERKTGLVQGVHAYLVKPVLPDTLHHLVDQVALSRSLDPFTSNSGNAS